MPEENATTDTAVETEEAPAPYTFPFDVPEDLATASEDDLRALHVLIVEHAQSFGGRSPDPSESTPDVLAAIHACVDLAREVTNEIHGRRERAAEAASLLDDIAFATIEDQTGEDDGDVLPEPEPAPTQPEPATPAAVTAAGRRPIPRVRDVAKGSRAPQLPAETQRTRFGSMVAAADLAGFSTGSEFANFGEAVKALTKRMDQYPSHTAQKAKFSKNKRPITVYDEDDPGRRHSLKTYGRHSVVEFRREFPSELRVTEDSPDGAGYRVAQLASSEKRLPGGGLIQSAQQSLKQGRSLTAAAGWCAPSETIYDLIETETEDGILDAPEMETPRGGWNIPVNGGPEFATIYGQLGNGGDTHLTEAEVIDDRPKICTEIPCPDFDEVRLGVDYYCLTGGLLQRRGYPEAVARFSRAAVVALAHKINYGFIRDIVAGSTNAGTVPIDLAGDDAASALLSAVDLAIMDAHYRNRGGFTSTMEVPLPRWVLVQIRAAMSRRTGVALMAVTDAQILEWFTVRNAVPRFVVDWQDAFSGVPTGPGGATPLLALPHEVEFLVYPAGTWVKAVQDVVSLDTIYDSTLLTTNQYTAVFAETGWAALKMQPLSRRYTAHVDPSGVVGCCDAPGALIS